MSGIFLKLGFLVVVFGVIILETLLLEIDKKMFWIWLEIFNHDCSITWIFEKYVRNALGQYQCWENLIVPQFTPFEKKQLSHERKNGFYMIPLSWWTFIKNDEFFSQNFTERSTASLSMLSYNKFDADLSFIDYWNSSQSHKLFEYRTKARNYKIKFIKNTFNSHAVGIRNSKWWNLHY